MDFGGLRANSHDFCELSARRYIRRGLSWYLHQTTDLGVGSSSLSGRASVAIPCTSLASPFSLTTGLGNNATGREIAGRIASTDRYRRPPRSGRRSRLPRLRLPARHLACFMSGSWTQTTVPLHVAVGGRSGLPSWPGLARPSTTVWAIRGIVFSMLIASEGGAVRGSRARARGLRARRDGRREEPHRNPYAPFASASDALRRACRSAPARQA
jgi:hypothetical protein